MDDHFDIGSVFEIGKFDITRLTCIWFYVPEHSKAQPAVGLGQKTGQRLK